MVHIETIVDDLRVMAAGVDAARDNATAADAKAHAIAAQAARSGFTGIATSMSRLRSAIAEIQAPLVTVGGLLSEAVSMMVAVPMQMSPERTVAVLAALQETVSNIRDQVAATIVKVEESKQLTVAVLSGGQPGPMLSALDRVRQILVLVAQRGGMAAPQVETIIGRARRAGESAYPTGPGGLPPESGPTAGPTSDAPDALFDAAQAGGAVITRPTRLPPGAAPFDQAVADRVPRYGTKATKTTGILVLSDGRVLPPQDSGINGPALRLPRPRPGMDGNLVSHVEAHCVALMREHNVTQATLYINREPCRYPGRRPGEEWGCALALPYMLRPGETLTVYGRDGYVEVFRGLPR